MKIRELALLVLAAAAPASAQVRGALEAPSAFVVASGAMPRLAPSASVPALAALPAAVPAAYVRTALSAAPAFEARSVAAPPSAARTAIPSDDELRGRLERLPATNPEREAYISDLFKLAGAKAGDIVLQDIGNGKHNILVVKRGRTDRVIVVGGHHDKVRAGKGVIDNGTGSTMVVDLYQAMRDQETDATIVFAAFGREEEGLLGSEAFVRALSPEQRSRIDAMINLDSLGVDGTFSWKNNSTRALLDRAERVAARTHHDLVEAHLSGGNVDSSSFRAAGIPAITIYGASEEVIFGIIHGERDTIAEFDFAHYKNTYLLTLELLMSLDRERLGPVGRGGA